MPRLSQHVRPTCLVVPALAQPLHAKCANLKTLHDFALPRSVHAATTAFPELLRLAPVACLQAKLRLVSTECEGFVCFRAAGQTSNKGITGQTKVTPKCWVKALVADDPFLSSPGKSPRGAPDPAGMWRSAQVQPSASNHKSCRMQRNLVCEQWNKAKGSVAD